jgi:hypothetical protein
MEMMMDTDDRMRILDLRATVALECTRAEDACAEAGRLGITLRELLDLQTACARAWSSSEKAVRELEGMDLDAAWACRGVHRRTMHAYTTVAGLARDYYVPPAVPDRLMADLGMDQAPLY